MSDIAVVVIPVEGPIHLEVLDGLREMQAVVGGNIEFVCVGRGDLCLNEDGIGLGLEVNPRATAIFQKAHVGGEVSPILGTAFACSCPDNQGETPGVDPMWAAELLHG